jgi:dihydrofolate reductase
MKVSLIAAVSTDGFIAPENQAGKPSTSWTSPEDTAWFNRKTKEIGTVIMGRTTWETIPAKHRPLNNRLNLIYTTKAPSSIDAVQFDSVVNHDFDTTTPYTTSLPPDKLINRLSDHFRELAVIGGTSIYTLFMDAGMVDTLHLTVEPVLFGTGTPLFDKSLDTALQLQQVEHLNPNTLLLTYQIFKS